MNASKETLIVLGVAVTLLWGLSLWLLKKQMGDAFTTLQRIPPAKWFTDVVERLAELPGKQWFDEVHQSIKGLPDPERIKDHFDRLHRLANEINTLLLEGTIAKADIKDIRAVQQREIERAARTEDRVARNEGRLNNKDGKDR